MRISALLCDDLEEERLQLARLLQRYASRHDIDLTIETAADGEDFLMRFQPGRFDIVFMDIYMPGMDGEACARRMRELDSECMLIFVTFSLEHGMVSYTLRATDYLCKPVTQKDVDEALDWCLRAQRERFRTLSVRSEWEPLDLRLRDIRYIEIQRHTAFIFTEDRVVETVRSMSALEAEIDSADFLRCHRSFLVNLRHVEQLERRGFVMDNGACVPIGKKNAQEIREQYVEWVFLHNWKDSGAMGML